MHINFIITPGDIFAIICALFLFSLFIFCKICDKQEAKRKSEQDNIKEDDQNEAT